MPPRGDSPTDQAILIRDLIREELRRGLSRRSHRSEREGSVSSSSSQECSRSRLSCPAHLGVLVLRPLHVAVGTPVGARPAVTLRLAPPTCQEAAPPVAVVPLVGGFPCARRAQGHPLGYGQSSPSVASSYVCHAVGVRSPSVQILLWLCVTCSSPVTAALSVDDASSSLQVAVPVSRCHGPSTCSSSCVAVDSSVTCSCYR